MSGTICLHRLVFHSYSTRIHAAEVVHTSILIRAAHREVVQVPWVHHDGIQLHRSRLAGLPGASSELVASEEFRALLLPEVKLDKRKEKKNQYQNEA